MVIATTVRKISVGAVVLDADFANGFRITDCSTVRKSDLLRTVAPGWLGTHSADGLGVVSGLAAVKPTKGAGVPFHIRDAPLIA
jgi:hypothetical protein